jgi:glucose dehydrogenase
MPVTTGTPNIVPDNKWAASVLALSPNSGKIKWGFNAYRTIT